MSVNHASSSTSTGHAVGATSGVISTSTAASSSKIDFGTFLPVVTEALERLTASASVLPSGSDLSFHRTMNRALAKELDSSSRRVLTMTENLLKMVEAGQEEMKGKSGSKGKGKQVERNGVNGIKARRKLEDEEDVVDGYKRGVIGVVDGLLEDADSCLDELSGQKKAAAINIPASKLAAASQLLPGPFSGKSRARLPSSMLHAATMTKPQLAFPDAVDNTFVRSPWRPQLKSKPHAMVPLDFVVPLDYDLTAEERERPDLAKLRDAKEVRLRRHPYFYETRHLPYPTSMFTIATPQKPRSFDETPLTFVDTPEQLEEMVEKLKLAKEIAVDLEHHSMRSYHGFTCLIQISTREEDWVVDTLKLRGELREGKLGGVMMDPAIVKVFHGADSDIVWLERDFDIYVVNLFDTFHATKVLDFTAHSLASLLSTYTDFVADKRYQMADWRLRPLPTEMLLYARADTHFLLYIYDHLRNALLEKSSRPSSPADGESENMPRRNPQEAMREVLSRSAETALRLYEREIPDQEGKGSGGWLVTGRRWLAKGEIDQEVGAVWKALHGWRDRIARSEDESPFYIMPNSVLLQLSQSRIVNIQGVINVMRGKGRYVEQEIPEIWGTIKKAREEFRLEQQAKQRSSPSPPSSPKKARSPVPGETAKTSPKVNPLRPISPPPVRRPIKPAVVDLWGDVTSVEAASAPPKRKEQSGLFGKSLATTPKTGSNSVVKQNPTSALFGKTVKGKKAVAATPFSKVKNEIFSELHGARSIETAAPVAEPSSTVPDKAALPAVETVPFVSSSSRFSGLKPITASSSKSATRPAPAPGSPGKKAPDTLPPVMAPVAAPVTANKPKKDEIVQVKKKQKKRERAKSMAELDGEGSKKAKSDDGVPSPIAAADKTAEQLKDAKYISATGTTSASKPKTKSSKGKKAAPADIPTFDYANEPNLLDNPKSGGRPEKPKKEKRKKKEGGEKKVMTGADFGPAPKDKSGMRSGNRSGTFM